MRGFLRFKGVNFWRWGGLFLIQKLCCMSVCIVQNFILSLLFGFLFCRIKKCTKMRHISGELHIQYSMKLQYGRSRVRNLVWYSFLKKLIPQSYQWWAKQPFFCFVCFCQSLAVCEAILFSFFSILHSLLSFFSKAKFYWC